MICKNYNFTFTRINTIKEEKNMSSYIFEKYIYGKGPVNLNDLNQKSNHPSLIVVFIFRSLTHGGGIVKRSDHKLHQILENHERLN